MEVIQHINRKVNVLLAKDYCPNPAMMNEFQSQIIACRMEKIELCGPSLKNFIVENHAQFIKLHLEFRNLTPDSITLTRDDFSLRFDGLGPFEPESYFKVKYQFQDEFSLEGYEVIKGCMVFVVASSFKKLIFCYEECIDDMDKTYKLKYNMPQ